MILQDLPQNLTQDLKVFFDKILESSCQQLHQEFLQNPLKILKEHISKILARLL